MVAALSLIASVSTAVLLATQAAAGQQQPFVAQAGLGQLKSLSSYNGSASLASVDDSSFTTLTHREFSGHRVRIKETTGYCDPSVRCDSERARTTRRRDRADLPPVAGRTRATLMSTRMAKNSSSSTLRCMSVRDAI